MNYDKKRIECIVLIGAIASFIFVCGALMNEGIQIVVQEENGASEATTGRIEANAIAKPQYLMRHTAKADIHNTVSEKQADVRTDQMRSDGAEEKQSRTCLPTDRAESGEEQASAASDGETLCLSPDRLVRGFGWQEENGVWRYHAGIDIAADGGSEVCAVSDGTVHRIERGAGGYLIEVSARDKLWLYEPLAEVTVMVGDSIRRGQRLGCMAGSADRLHIACRRGDEWLDPQRMLKQAQ